LKTKNEKAKLVEALRSRGARFRFLFFVFR